MNALRHFRRVAFLEGLSFIVLLFIAMPLKYLAGLPLAVRVIGMVHGLLFVAFVVTLARTAVVQRWSLGRTFLAFVASLVPFGTFVLDRSLLAEIAKTELAKVQPPRPVA